ncbi:hypothetical protein [Malikia sp.]|uniref:hypothetical protein n=1 Tax=Malikia sp. TaxID=2070706 RepID=UPI0026102CB2|nr:hypothetical protein [Malikia sp.]MDD2728442.1 hypothetical protein [Malikia sp.]
MIPALQQPFADAIHPAFTQAFSQATELTRRPMAVPFEAARQQYSLAVRAGLQPNSMLAYRDHFKTLDQLEKATLGPFARQL